MEFVRRSLTEMFGKGPEKSPDLKSRARQEVQSALDEIRVRQAEQGQTEVRAQQTPLEKALGNLDYFNDTVRGMEALNEYLSVKNKAISLSSPAESYTGAKILFDASNSVYEERTDTVHTICNSYTEVVRGFVTHDLLRRGAIYGRSSANVLAHDRSELLSRVLKQIK